MGSIEAKKSQIKIDKVAVLEEKIGKAQSLIFADFKGLTVTEMNELRGLFFKADEAEFVVAKNTLVRIALANKGFEVTNDDLLSGPTGVALGYNDPVTPAKVIADYAKKHEKPAFKGAMVDGEFYGIEQVKELAALPPVEQLYAMIVGSIASPLSGFVGVLNETVRSFVGVIDAIIQKKQAEEAA